MTQFIDGEGPGARCVTCPFAARNGAMGGGMVGMPGVQMQMPQMQMPQVQMAMPQMAMPTVQAPASAGTNWASLIPWLIMGLLVVYCAIEMFSGRWQPFGAANQSRTVTVSLPTYGMNYGQTQGMQADGNFAWTVDPATRQVIIGQLPLTTEMRAQIAQYESQGFQVVPWVARTTTVATAVAAAPKVVDADLLKQVTELRAIVDRLKQTVTVTHKNRFSPGELRPLSDDFASALKLIDEAKGRIEGGR